MERLSQPVTQLHGINTAPSRAGTPAFGESLCPECTAGNHHLKILRSSGEAAAVIPCTDFLGRPMIQDQDDHPVKV